MSSTSPAGGNTFSEVSSASGSAPSTPAHLRPFTSMSITELVISEAHYLTTIDRVANALTQVADKAAATGRKESMTMHALTERWFEIIRMHSKFHDNIVAVGEDLREIAALMNGLNSEHSFAEWDSALRQPFEHLSTYAEWLLRIDPQSKFCKDYRSHLNGLIYKIRMVTEANQHPRNMLRRLSTMARGVIKRRSSVQFLTHSPTSNPGTPITPKTPISASSNISNGTSMTDKLEIHAMTSMSNISTDSLPMAQTVRSLEIATNYYMDDATTDLASPRDRKYGQIHEKDLPATPSAGSDADEPSTPIADTFLSAASSKQLQHCASAASDVSCMGTLVSVAPSPSTSSSSVYSKSESLQSTSLTREKFLSDMDARKATLRVGASQTIQAKAESLQSPTFKPRFSNDNVRKVSATKKEANNKPPVKSLISFWEQVSDPLDA
ncbi:hypothetical protein BG011_008620 [Mortierella polycephala]|uniref:DH domain-containing protein n=1 Tax=Mortierella polycephala TaxID=41804 RepID=A0A9P6QDI3_9FUNG|nr:hypothetical protein BG011_008620 [Mortierella polycephala]